MAIASGTNVVVGFKEETTYGVSAGSDANYDIIPFKSASLSLAKTNHESAVITGNRELQDVIMGAHSVSGEIAFDLAHQPAYLKIMQAVLGEDADGADTAYGVGSTRQSFTIYQDFTTDIQSGNAVHIYTGCEFNNFSMSIPADGLIECSVGIVGATMVPATTALDSNGLDDDGSEYIEVNDPYHSSNATITSDFGAICTDLSLSIENGIETTNKVGDVIPIQGGIGKCRVSGSLTAHFTSDALLQKFVDNSTSSSLTIAFGSNAGGMSFTMDKIIYTTGAVEVGGEGLLSVSMDFVAVANNAATSALVIDTDLS